MIRGGYRKFQAMILIYRNIIVRMMAPSAKVILPFIGNLPKPDAGGEIRETDGNNRETKLRLHFC